MRPVKRGNRLKSAATRWLALLGVLVAISTQPAMAQASPLETFINSYVEEWGKPPKTDPNAPVSRWPTSQLPPQPETIPPYPFTEWPFGGASAIGATIPNSQGGALMKALAVTDFGQWLKDNHIEIYGWINGGGNVSTAHTPFKNANFPAAYMYSANTVELDQAVLYIERLPDTVQRDHIDWGFRLSAMYGENYRYTTSLGIATYQFQKLNNFNGYDFPMVYGELYFPYIAQGMVVRAGRFISVPDIEAQLAPNNYMYSHSMTYTYDNYTNTGINATFLLSKNWQVQVGLLDGTETALWVSHDKDPGNQPSLEACVRWTSDTAYDNVYVCADGINDGSWGYNNLQWYGFTYYHKFNENWHISWEFWDMHENRVPDVSQGYVGTPFFGMRNPPNEAICKPGETKCVAKEWSTVAYLNYKFSPLDNISWRAEYFDDQNGQRTGFKTRYLEYAIGWQHWFSPSVTFRPEVTWYDALDTKAFDNGRSHTLTLFAADVIWHF